MIVGTTLVVMAYPVAGALLLARRFRRTGQRPAPRWAPLGMFWVLPVVFVGAVVACGWSIHAEIASMAPCRPHTQSASLNTGGLSADTI